MMQDQHQGLSHGFNESCQGKRAEHEPKKHPPPVSVRLTEEERAKLEADAQGGSLSAHIRQCLFGDGAAPRKRRSRTPTIDQAALARVLGLLGQTHIANNLNQLAKASHVDQLAWDDHTRQQIDEAYRIVRDMRDALVQALGLIDGDQS